MRHANTLLVSLFLLSTFCCAGLNVTNYSLTALAGTYTQIKGNPGVISPALNWGSLDDGYINSIPIGFSFIYESNSYTTVSASTNGFCRLGGTFASNSWSANNLATGTPRPMIAPLWDDNMMAASGDISYITTGVAPNRVFTIEWLDVYYSYLSGSASISFQVKLYESNRRIEFVYRQEAGTSTSPSASIGLGGAISGTYLSLNGTGAAPTASSSTETNTIWTRPNTGQIYRFDHYAIVPVITSVTPLAGQYNTTVTITGSGFDAAPASNIVFFGATKATVLTSTYTTLTVSVPEDLTHRELTVTTLNSHLTATANDIFDLTYPCGNFMSNSSFSGNSDFSSGSFVHEMTSCDIDGDGRTDIATATNAGISILRNISVPGVLNGTSFAAEVIFPSSGGAGNVIFADVDGDGKKDMICADYSVSGEDSICIWRNISTPGSINAGSFSPKVRFEAGSYPHVAAGDIDGDGKLDLVVSSVNENSVSVYRNVSTVGSITTGSFLARVAYAAGNKPWDAQVDDIDQDGKSDIVVTNGQDNTMYIYRNTAVVGTINAASLASPVSFTTGNYPEPIDIADMDGNGVPDIIIGNVSTSANSFSVFRSLSSPGTIIMAPRVDVPRANGVSGMDIGDIDGDGKPDVATSAAYAVSVVSITKNNSTPGTISISAGGNFATGGSTSDVVIGDLDRDGQPDLAVGNGNSSTVSILRNVINTFSVIAPLTVLNSVVYCDDGTWKTYADPANPTRVLFAVKDNGNDLGVITVSEYEDGSPGNYNGIRFLARHFKVTPTTQPSTAVQVRLFYTAAELTALMAVAPSVTGAGSLNVTKYDGPTEDGTYFPGDATSLVAIPAASITTGTMYGGNYLQFSISSFSEFWIHGWGGVLPIELLSFNATPNGEQVDLDWATATEINNHFFTVERTHDGQHFETVSTVQGAGNSTTELHYAAIDEHPFAGTSYYRLKQTDFNGQFSYSELRTVTFTDANAVFSVYPNPSNGSFNIACPGNEEDMVRLEIMDAAGRLIVQKEETIAELRYVSNTLPQGVYMVKVIIGEKKYFRQVVVI